MAGQVFQAAVVPYRVRRGTVEIALVTTLDGKRWIIPKGSLARSERARQAASRETEEEAGLRGVVGKRPIGRYEYAKAGVRYQVQVYLMRVTVELDRWHEARRRRRRWFAADKAATRLQNNDLSSLVLAAEAYVLTSS